VPYKEEGVSYWDLLQCYRLEFAERLQFKSLKGNPDHRDKAEGAIDKAVVTAIVNAINGHYQLSIFYMGDKENAPGWRTIQPYVYGLSKYTGNQLLRAYWVSGKSVSHHFPRWRLYRLDRIGNITSNTTQIFDKAKPLYNFFWDRSMSARFVWWRKNKNLPPLTVKLSAP
jgi:predicted DNA-binding transcriptional regulator YafY